MKRIDEALKKQIEKVAPHSDMLEHGRLLKLFRITPEPIDQIVIITDIQHWNRAVRPRERPHPEGAAVVIEEKTVNA
jgi:hypothetical protein